MHKTIVTFKAIREGRVIHKSIPIYHNYYPLSPKDFKGIVLPLTTVEAQVIDMLDKMDKTDLMLKHGFDAIIDYFPKKKRIKRNEIVEFIKYCEPYLSKFPQFTIPFSKIISQSKDILFRQGKSNEQKFKEVLNMFDMSLKASANTIKLIENILMHQENKTIK